ncbi:MAG: DUF1080 domain-containing protein [Planctomycetota bacterium]
MLRNPRYGYHRLMGLPMRFNSPGLFRLPAMVLLLTIALLTSARPGLSDDAADLETGFVSLFDGESLNGWKKSDENPESCYVEDGMLVCAGARCHLFYVGGLAPMDDFHFKAEVMTTPGSNAGIYFHTQYQETGWPKYGYECQVNVSHKDPKKTSSLYAVDNVDDPGVDDGEWYTQEIIVRDRHIILKVNGKTMVDHTEPENKPAFSDAFERRLGEGTFALQAHDPDSKVYFRNLRVKKLDE